MSPLVLFNTLSRSKEEFVPSDPSLVRMYCCGPTVYNYAHIGNLRTYIFEDLLHRILLLNGYAVKHVMNITDVGHMTSDSDAGDDKMQIAAAREKKSPWELARFYEDAFFHDCARLNIIRPDVAPRATEHVDQMIKLIQQLEAKGYTYETPEGIYFDTAKNDDYGKLAGLNLAGQREGAREDVNVDTNKRHPADFILWFTNKPTHIMKWESPWGTGYPGWHIECSAMSMEYLGETLDIHCGGIDHIPVHNTNEIAQSECATGHVFARYWVHGAFLNVASGAVTGRTAEKMSKSDDNFLKVQKLVDDGYDPLAYRYMCLMAHYRSELTYSDEALKAATTALSKVWELKARQSGDKGDGLTDAEYAEARTQVIAALNDDLNLPRAVAALQGAKSYRLWLEFDSVLGLDIEKRSREATSEPGGASDLPTEITALMAERDAARKAKNWAASDALRTQIEEQGYTVGDSPAGTVVQKKLL
ncbi:MAG: cysteine--tRNA ligase [Capsulimonas sp.]|uniref:cysteine--tRNA ligase n=1 Tax=Capsulimonas sp. TaxID=2494211 RepID=UPI003266F5C8